MRALIRIGLVVWVAAILGATAPAGAAPLKLEGEYESARTPDDEFVRLTLKPDGKALIVAENNFQIPGDASKRRGRTTTYAKWTRKGAVVTLTYSKIRDRLRYDLNTPLAQIGATGTAPALSVMGKADQRSRLKSLVFWRLPHAYRLPEPVAAPARAPDSPK